MLGSGDTALALPLLPRTRMSLATLPLVLLQQAVAFPQPVMTTPEGYPPVGFGGDLAVFEETLIVGDGYAFAGEAGRAFAFRRSEAGHWLPTGVLEVSPALVTQDIGVAVAAGSTTAVLGAPSSPEFFDGRAHVFELAGNWQQVQTLSGSQGSLGDEFAKALALDGDRLLVGAPSTDTLWVDGGAAYLFERGLEGTWQETEVFSIDGPSVNSKFGAALDLDGDRLVIAAPGFAYNRVEVWAHIDGAWTREALLTEPDGDLNAKYGASVALSGDRLVVGAPLSDGPQGEFWQGRVLIYERSLDGNWTLEATLRPSHPTSSDQFGTSVDLFGERLAVGAPYADTFEDNCGAVSLFHLDGGEWVEGEQLLGPCGDGENRFGNSVALSADALLTGGKGPLFDDFVQPWALEPFATLTGWPAELSVGDGGEQQLRIDLGPTRAGLTYLTVGSASGTAPATLVGGIAVPLVADSYSLMTVSQANSGPFVATLGTLDEAGRAEPSLQLPALSDPALSGLLLHHAALVFDTGGGLQAVAATSAVDLTLGP